MKITTAITRGLAGTLCWKGRASRTEYWLFLPVGLALPMLAIAAARGFGHDIWTAIVTGLVALLPLVALTSRRALDSGETIWATVEPTLNLLALLGWIWLTGRVKAWFDHAFIGADGPPGFGLAIVFWITMPIMALITLRIFLSGLIGGAALFSQMAEPSQSGANRYGPNPSEVQP